MCGRYKLLLPCRMKQKYRETQRKVVQHHGGCLTWSIHDTTFIYFNEKVTPMKGLNQFSRKKNYLYIFTKHQ